LTGLALTELNGVPVFVMFGFLASLSLGGQETKVDVNFIKKKNICKLDFGKECYYIH
jgi:hypothetical protein